MTTPRNIRYATDLVTFYNPAYWGGKGDLDGIHGLFEWSEWTPATFWEKVLSDVQEAGLEGIELTFGPGHWQTAKAAYGSGEGFAQAVRDHGLEVCSGFLSTTAADGRRLAFTNAEDHAQLEEMVAAYAEFLAPTGCEYIIATLPIRKNRAAKPPLFVDAHIAQVAVDGLHKAAARAAEYGITLAMHPEAFTMFRSARDVDLFMALLDPTYVNLCPDTAQFTVAGSDPVAIAERHKDRVVLAHWKDATGPAPKDVPIDDTIFARQVQWFAPVGQGVVDWPAWMRLMRDINYTGWAVFELDVTPDPVGDLRAMKAFLEGSLGHIYR